MFRRLFLLTALLSGSAPLAAQTAAPPPHLSVVEGRAEVARGTDREAAIANTPLTLGDQLRTEDGRAEVLLGDGSLVHLDGRTILDVNGDNVVRLTAGRLIVLTDRNAGPLQIDTPSAQVRLRPSSEVHLALYGDQGRPTLQVAVVRGWADVDTGNGTSGVDAGQQVLVQEGDAAPYPTAFNTARFDDFTRWSMALMDSRRGATSTQYLPADVRMYGSTFDQYGSWNYDASYGYVWYPRVAVGWRPYYHGRWRHAGHYGWTFVGYDPWGWATHHYGRWGLSAGGSWFWIPSAGWGAAWVSWAVSPGYVGWCPLGWNNRPVIGWGHGPYYARYKPHYGYGGHWRAWNVVPVHSFRGGAPIHRQHFDPAPFRRGPRAPNFIVQPTPPNIAVPRGSVVAPGARIAGPSVTPRNGQPRRGSAVPDPGSMLTPSRRGSTFASRGAAASASAPAASASMASPSRGAATPPPVVYYRGGSVSSDSSGARAYERAGVAVPRGLPSSPTPPSRDGARSSTSPYGANISPYGANISPYNAPTAQYAAPRGGDRGAQAPPTRGPEYGAPAARAPEYRVPDRRGPEPRGPENRAPQYRAPESPRSRGDAGRPPSAGPRGGDNAAPRAGAPRGDGGSRGSGAGAARSSGGHTSYGTAVRRR